MGSNNKSKNTSMKLGIFVLFSLLLVWASISLYSSRLGISGKTSVTSSGCGGAGCHGPEISNPETVINVESGSGYYTMVPNSSSTYTVTIRNFAGFTAGVNIAVVDQTGSNAGTLSNIQNDLKLMNDELVHTAPKLLENSYVTFQFSWKAPNLQGRYLIMVAACATNNDNQASASDQWSWMLPVEITVDAGPPIISVSPGAVDFGDVKLGRSKDTLILVRNTGKNPLRISGIEMAGDNASEFSLPGSSLFELEPDSSKFIRVRFIPKDMTGWKYAQIQITNNTNVSPKTVTLAGKCTSMPMGKIVLSRTSFDFGECKINEYVERDLTIFNKGDFDLTINSANISGKQNSEFSFASPTNFTLQVDSSAVIKIRFNPKTTGDKFAEMNFTSNSSSDPVVALLGYGLPGPKPTLLLSANEIDFGKIAVSKSKDTSITMKNIGELPLDVSGCKVTGGNSLEYSIISGGGSFYLETNQERELKIRFTPKVSGDNKMASIEFTCNDDAKPELKMTGEAFDLPKPILTVGVKEIDFGSVTERRSKDTFVLITNSGNDVMYLDEPVFKQNTDSNEFSVQTFMFPRTLYSGENLKVNFRIHPVKAGNKGAIVEFNSNGGTASVNFLASATVNDVDDASRREEFSISPNPATDFIEICVPISDMSFPRKRESITIYDVFGREINPTPALPKWSEFGSPPLREDLGWVLRIDVSTLSPGFYFVRVGDEISKFVVM